MLVPATLVRSLQNPKTFSLRTRGPDIENRTVVGVRSFGVCDGNRTDSDGNVNTSGRGVASIGIVVTGGDDGGDTGIY